MLNREGDLVLVYYQDKPSIYGRIEAIEPDVKRDWYQLTLLLLTIPSQVVTWILRQEYINGTPFTMGGQPIRLEKVKVASARVPRRDESQPPGPKATGKPVRVIPFKKPS